MRAAGQWGHSGRQQSRRCSTGPVGGHELRQRAAGPGGHAAVKLTANVNTPVLLAGRIISVVAEETQAERKSDLVAMTRATITTRPAQQAAGLPLTRTLSRTG